MAKKKRRSAASDLKPKRFVPLTFGLIDEGELQTSLDEEFTEVSKALIDHVMEYEDAAVKARAELHLKVAITWDGTNYLVTHKVKTTRPGRPTRATRADMSAEQTGEPSLFVLSSGSSEDDPKQLKFAARDGRLIDGDGKVHPHPPKEG